MHSHNIQSRADVGAIFTGKMSSYYVNAERGGERVFGPKISHGSLTFNAVAFGAAYLFVIPTTVPRCSGGNYARENIERVDTCGCGHAIMSHACTVANSYQKMTASH